jgi:hypothetical protein
MEFKSFKKKMQEAFSNMVKTQDFLYITNVDRDKLWETYINSFEDPTIRQEHTCNCCRSFIKNYAATVAIIDGKIKTIWDFPVNETYDKTVLEMNKLVSQAEIVNVFVSKEKKGGTDSNKQITEIGTVTRDHFYLEFPAKFVSTNDLSIASLMGTHRDNRNVFKRSLEEISQDALETVLELIGQGSIYRGEEFKSSIQEFLKYKKEYDKASNKEVYCWVHSPKLPIGISKIRNHAIGTLLLDVSNGRDLNDSVDSFEVKVAGNNYKRPVAIATKGMIDNAKTTIESLGYMSSLNRRFATAEDIKVTDLLFVNRFVKKAGDIFDQLKDDVPVNPRSYNKVDEIQIEDFIKNVLPNINSMELLLENKHVNNLVSLTNALDEDSKNMFKWNNQFAWSYNNAVTDSIKERVKEAGGRVDGCFRFSHSWNHSKRNASLMDLHLFLPGSNISLIDSCNNNYGNNERIGWNHRKHTKTRGSQDVDYTSPAPEGYIPVENIVLPESQYLPDGKYICKIHNWNLRQPTQGGFRAEIEFNNEIYNYELDRPMKDKEWVTVAIVTLNKGVWSIEHKMEPGFSISQQEHWGMKTNKFQKVSMMMLSPNHWEGQVGNKHYMFMLEGAKNDGPVRGFYNEYLKEELVVHRQAFELIGGKLPVHPVDKELSGVGFSSTQRNSVICKVEGKFTRVLKINF